MAKLQTKHANEENIVFTSFDGGLNMVSPPESLADNEMQAATNFEFDVNTGLLKVRGGLRLLRVFAGEVTDIIPISGGDACLVVERLATQAEHNVWKFVNNTASLVGQIDGDLPVSYEYYGDAGNVALVAGGHLHLYYEETPPRFVRVATTNSPTKANTIFYRDGCLAVTQLESDRISYSAIGDPERWEILPSDPVNTGYYVDVGYKDGCQMAAIGSMVGEVIVFKCPPNQPEQGRIYRLQGAVGNWSIILFSKGMAAWNSNALTQVANNMLFLTRDGLSSLATATEYGDYKTAWPGAKINSKLAAVLTSGCRLFHVAIRGQVFAWDGVSTSMFCYHYQVGDGAWTQFQFPDVVKAVASVAGVTYVGLRTGLYEMNDTLTIDTLPDGIRHINALWMPRTITRNNQILVKKVRCNYLNTQSSNGHVDIEGLQIPLPISGFGETAATDPDTAATDPDPLVPYRTATVRIRCNIVRWDVTPQVVVSDGLFSLATLSLGVAEV